MMLTLFLGVLGGFILGIVMAILGVAELEKIVVEPVYSAKVYLNKSIKEGIKNGENICVEKKGEEINLLQCRSIHVKG